jgi:LysR family transcriptional regulator of abg operon
MQAAHLRDFIAVADQGSLRAAARHLDLSQGAISKNLMALEKELGVSLLVRSAHGVEPTEQGRILLRRARLADAEMRKAREELAALAGKRLGTVQVGLSCTAEALIGAEAIRRFRGDFPDSSVYTRGGTPWTLLHLLREGKLDFAVTNVDGPALGPDLQAQRLFSTDYVVVARADHPLAGATSLSELGGCEWIQGSLPDEFEPSMETAFRKAGLPQPRVAAQRDAFSALFFILLQSDYVAVATEAAVAPLCGAGLLKRIPVAEDLGVSVQSLLVSSSRPLGPHAQAMADAIRRISRGLRR